MRLAAIALFTAALATPALADWDDDCKHTVPHHATTPAAGVTKVVIHADSGFLKVDGTPGAAQISLSGTACSSEEDFLRRMTLSMRKVGSELRIESNIPDKTVFFGFFSARLDFTVTLPAGIPVTIDDDSGWIKVTNTGALTIDDDSGSIEARNIRGPVVINDDSGSIEIDGVTGNVTVEDDSGELTVRNVSGSVEIEDDSGAITVARVEGSLRIRQDDSGSITVQNVKRDVTIDDDSSGSIEVVDIGGNFTVGRKGSGHIDYDRVAGKVSVPKDH